MISVYSAQCDDLQKASSEENSYQFVIRQWIPHWGYLALPKIAFDGKSSSSSSECGNDCAKYPRKSDTWLQWIIHNEMQQNPLIFGIKNKGCKQALQ